MNDLVVCGRKVGTFDGWDGDPHETLIFYKVVPLSNINIPAGDIGVDFTRGVIETYDAEGNVTFTADLIDTLKHLERTQ